MRVLIVGCGYVGQALGVELVRQGHEVFGLRRSVEGAEALKALGISPLVADVTKPSELAALPSKFDWVVNLVSSSKGGLAEYRSVYYEGTRNLIQWLAAAPPKKLVFTSSTSVYGQTDGSSVKESSPVEPSSDTSKLLVEAERLLLDVGSRTNIPVVILRVAGIYGPGRGHLFLQYLKNQAKMQGRGERFLNMIHREDLVRVIAHVLKHGRAGEIYNVVDDEPVREITFFTWLSETLGKWMPPFAPAEESANRKRGQTNKSVSNRRLKMELGYQFKYPTFRQGYTAEIDRLEKAGELDIKPEPRE